MKHEPASAPANQSDTAPLRSDNVLSAASPIGRRLKHDMDRLFGRGELRVLARGDDERDRSYSLNRSRAVRSTPSGRACRILNQSIADCLDMQSQSRQAAWMLAGPGHRSERMLLAKAVALIEQQVDQLGRRIVELGGPVEGSVRQVAARSGLNEHPAAADDVAAHIESVVLAFGLVSGAMREDCGELSALGDETSRKVLGRTAEQFTHCHERLETLLSAMREAALPINSGDLRRAGDQRP